MDVAQVDKDGFLIDVKDWTPSFAENIAKTINIKFTNQHWKVIYGVREFYVKTGISPTMRMLVKLVRNEIDVDLGSSIALSKLFTNSSSKIVAQLSGLPKPSDCI